MDTTNENKLTFGQFLHQTTMQIFADRYKMKLKIREVNKNKEERIYFINYSDTNIDGNKKRDIASSGKINNAPTI